VATVVAAVPAARAAMVPSSVAKMKLDFAPPTLKSFAPPMLFTWPVTVPGGGIDTTKPCFTPVVL